VHVFRLQHPARPRIVRSTRSIQPRTHLIVANLQEERVQYAKTPLVALREHFGGDHVRYAKGCDILTERNADAPVFPATSIPMAPPV
jgi:hypothetical protein